LELATVVVHLFLIHQKLLLRILHHREHSHDWILTSLRHHLEGHRHHWIHTSSHSWGQNISIRFFLKLLSLFRIVISFGFVVRTLLAILSSSFITSGIFRFFRWAISWRSLLLSIELFDHQSRFFAFFISGFSVFLLLYFRVILIFTLLLIILLILRSFRIFLRICISRILKKSRTIICLLAKALTAFTFSRKWIVL